jgi:hypothetical protein
MPKFLMAVRLSSKGVEGAGGASRAPRPPARRCRRVETGESFAQGAEAAVGALLLCGSSLENFAPFELMNVPERPRSRCSSCINWPISPSVVLWLRRLA